MLKKQYILELKTKESVIVSGMKNSPDVRKVQEWINLWKRYDHKWKVSALIDGDFGPATLSVIKEFQKYHGLTVDGIVGNMTWQKLIEPMRKAFSRVKEDLSLKELIVAYAKQHLASSPREFKQNEGTWVRSYMDGNEGSDWPWCMGFVQTIIDQATFTIGQKLTDYMPKSYSCDVVGSHGHKNNNLIRNADLRKDSSIVEAGDIFLNVKKPFDWTHTGIVIGVEEGWIQTIEGNTNDEGSREGYEVCERKRDLNTKNIDIFRIIPK
jgi:hypothetical protein